MEIRIGDITLPHRAVFGPMAGFTDAPCRRLMAAHGAGFTVSEMVFSRALTYGDHKTLSLLRPATKGAPYGVQLFGEVPGDITLPHRAVFGPMAGFTDAPCRRLMAAHGAGFTVSEMVFSRALTYGDHKTLSLLRPATKGAPYGVQLFGEVPEIMGQAAACIEGEDFDFLDINMGCPAPCRRLMAAHGAGFTVSEMVFSRALTYRDHKTLSLLRPATKGAPYGVQLFGEVPEIMGQAAAMIEGEDFDFLDINMGCPAPKIVSGGAGSKLMLHPELCGEIVAQVKAHTSRPVTVKMRKGWDDEHVTAVECAKACQQAGAALITVHARTRAQMYIPGIDLAIIRAVKQAVDIPVIGNGDIQTSADALAMLEQTGCDGVMIARGALGDPWLFERVNAAIEGLPGPPAPNLQARMNALRRQVEEMVELKGEYTAMPQARAQAIHYMKGLKGAAALRRAACSLTYLSDLDSLIDTVFTAQRKLSD